MLSDLVMGALIGMMVAVGSVPIYRSYRDRRHIWVKCKSSKETELLADRVAGYTEMHPAINAVLVNGRLVHYVRVPKGMLVDVKQDEAIRKLKEPLNAV